MTHPLAASAVKAACDPGATAEGKNSIRRDKCSCGGTGACRFIPLSHETFGRTEPATFALLDKVVEFDLERVASSVIVS